MNVRLVICAVLLAGTAAAAMAQNLQSVQPVQMVRPTAAATAIDEAVMLRAENQRLKEQLEKLKAEGARCRAEVDSYRVLGGSQVHAYCEAGNDVSRNTAGATTDCAPSGYKCEPVSGLCRTSCSYGPDCATGFTCDPPSGKCIRTG